jgi:hypothetical protein
LTRFLKISIAILLTCSIFTAKGQTENSSAKPDSVQNVPEIAGQGNLKKEKIAPIENYWHPEPSRALWYSVLCPGLGQIYNRSYWKVPVIYGGGAVLGYLISWQGRMYNDYSNAYYDIMDNDPNTKSYETLFKNINGTEEWKKNTLKKKRDNYRRNRDLCIFGIALVYVLNVVDAYVDAQLYDFSVTDDLSLHVTPVFNNPYLNEDKYGINDPTVFGVQCSITF